MNDYYWRYELHRYKQHKQATLKPCPFCLNLYEHQSALSDHAYFKHGQIIQTHKGNKMEEQMEQVWRAKDGKGGFITGSKEEVEAYLATLSPLGEMRFPYWVDGTGFIRDSSGDGVWGNADDAPMRKALIAFANLAPLYQPVIDAWTANNRNWRGRTNDILPAWSAARTLLLAYEEVLKLVPR